MYLARALVLPNVIRDRCVSTEFSFSSAPNEALQVLFGVFIQCRCSLTTLKKTRSGRCSRRRGWTHRTTYQVAAPVGRVVGAHQEFGQDRPQAVQVPDDVVGALRSRPWNTAGRHSHAGL